MYIYTYLHCNTVQHTATHCSVLHSIHARGNRDSYASLEDSIFHKVRFLYIFIYIYVYMNTHIYIHICTYTIVLDCLILVGMFYIYVCIYTYICICTYVRIHTYMYIYICIIYMCVYVHAITFRCSLRVGTWCNEYLYTLTHAYTHTCGTYRLEISSWVRCMRFVHVETMTPMHRLQVLTCNTCSMGWLWLVDSLSIQVSFADYSLFCRALLQKRRIFSGSLLIVATP